MPPFCLSYLENGLKFLLHFLFVAWYQMTIFWTSTMYKALRRRGFYAGPAHVFSPRHRLESHPTHIQSSTLGSLVVGHPQHSSQDAPASYNCSCLCANVLSPQPLPHHRRVRAWTTNLHPGSRTLLLSNTEGETYTFSLTHRGVVRTKEITLNNSHLFGILFLKLFWDSCKLFQNYFSKPPFVIWKILLPQ